MGITFPAVKQSFHNADCLAINFRLGRKTTPNVIGGDYDAL
jgi:hypothetical protein